MWEALGDYRGPLHIRAFLWYLLAKLKRRATEKSYRTYVTDSLRNIPFGQAYTRRWYDIAYGSTNKKDTRTPEEIVESVFTRAGIREKPNELA